MKDKDQKDNKSKERCSGGRRSKTLNDAIVDRHKVERRVIIQEIDFKNRRKSQIRAKMLGINYQDNRIEKRRKMMF